MSHYPAYNAHFQPLFDPFPLTALGQNLGRAVWDTHLESKLAIEAIASNALAVAAASVQDNVSVVRPNCPPSATSLFVTIIAATSEGKDTAASPFITPIKRVEEEINRRHDLNMYQFKARTAAHAAQRAEVQAQMRKAARTDADMSNLIETLAALESDAPHAPHLSRLLHNNVTAGALVQAIAKGDKNILAYTTEADGFLNGPMGREGSLLNTLWDGTPVVRERVNKAAQKAADYRFGMLLAVQPFLFEKYMKNRGVEAQHSGLFGRMLFARPSPTVGYRIIDSFPASSSNARDVVVDRIYELLMRGFDRRKSDQGRISLTFTTPGNEAFTQIYNKFQISMRQGNEFSSIRAQAGKGAEQVARVAAVLHAFDELEGPIGVDTLDRALQIVLWYMRQAIALFKTFQPADFLEADMWTIEDCARKMTHRGCETFSRLELRQLCASKISATRADNAINVLIDRNRLRPVPRRSGSHKLALVHQNYLLS